MKDVGTIMYKIHHNDMDPTIQRIKSQLDIIQFQNKT